ncbi:MAG: AAA family ATPase [Chloroflexota bacterium]
MAKVLETPAEQRAWELLIENFRWDPPEDLGITVRRQGDAPKGPAYLQIFEAAITATFARLRPDYEWQVTPLSGDGGVDFVGTQSFLTHDAYGIAAAITVGGQCKKHQNYSGLVHHDIFGPLSDMAETISPTFFVVAFSAHVSEQQVETARQRVEKFLQRDCHILDRPQVEGLLVDHLPVLEQVLAASDLDQHQVQEIRDYFSTLPRAGRARVVAVETPEDARAGESFSVEVKVRSSAAAATRLRWRPTRRGDGEVAPVDLVDPVEATMPEGADLAPESSTDDPFLLRRLLEFRTHSVGDVELGEIRVEPSAHDEDSPAGWTELQKLRITENLKPRFFEAPFKPQLRCLMEEYRRATDRTVVSVGVVGAGGSGKSRVCEEFSMEQRRRGCSVITAKQAKSSNDPHLMLADLFLGLIGRGASYENASSSVLREIAQYDRDLAQRCEPSIRSVFAAGTQRSGAVTEEGVLSALLLLVMARARTGPLIVHLQDLHWSSADVLGLLGGLLWQLEKTLPDGPSGSAGVLFILEGRTREKGSVNEGWDSRPFEVFLQRLDCRTTVCSALDRDQGNEFVTRLFESEYAAGPPVSANLLELQKSLIAQIDQSAGSNPFHSLEQIRLLKDAGVIAQNPETGFLYLIGSQPSNLSLPDTVFATVRGRWEYMRERAPELALLVWALALLEDRVPTPLFRRLWRGLAPDVSLIDLDATDLIVTGGAEGPEVAFRHENYFHALRKFEVSSEDRERAVDIYSEWFEEIESPDPTNGFRWAQVLLERCRPETMRARRLLSSARRTARRQGDLRLARQIAIVSLDASWAEDERSRAKMATFLRFCDEELDLVLDLLGSDRTLAGDRAEALIRRIEARLSGGRIRSASAPKLRQRLLTAEVRRSQYLFNDHRPAKAAEVAAEAIAGVEALRSETPDPSPEWVPLEMEALLSRAIGLALSGDIEEAQKTSTRALAIARRLRSQLAQHVVCVHAAVLMATDPLAADSILRDCIGDLDSSPDAAIIRDEAELDLSESLILRAYASNGSEAGSTMLDEAHSLLRPLFTRCFHIGQYPDAGAAALLLGVISVLRNTGDDVSWFARGVAAAARGGHMETLWRSHIDLATAMHRYGEPVGARVRDHATAAADIMEETLSHYARADASRRFDVLRSPLAQAARLLLLAEDERGAALLNRYPRLRESFASVDERLLRRELGDERHYQWLWVGEAGYMLY